MAKKLILRKMVPTVIVVSILLYIIGMIQYSYSDYREGYENGRSRLFNDDPFVDVFKEKINDSTIRINTITQTPKISIKWTVDTTCVIQTICK